MSATHCLAVVDIGDGPRTLRIVSRDALVGADDTVVPADSPLGRAVLGARVGDRIRFHSPGGPRMARVLALRRQRPNNTAAPTQPNTPSHF